MGEWSEYFEDFPEENPANWNKKDNPLQELVRGIQQSSTSKESNAARALKAWQEAKDRSFLLKEDCPQCGLTELNTYKINSIFYLCECQDCGIYGRGETHELALKNTRKALGDGLDWRENKNTY